MDGVTTSSSGMQKAFRIKSWKELNDSERIIKLQEEICRTERQVADLCKIVGKLLEHDHHDGHMIVKLNELTYAEDSPRTSLSFRVENFEERN